MKKVPKNISWQKDNFRLYDNSAQMQVRTEKQIRTEDKFGTDVKFGPNCFANYPNYLISKKAWATLISESFSNSSNTNWSGSTSLVLLGCLKF